jgi:uncharacterized protein (TIGR03437 family)
VKILYHHRTRATDAQRVHIREMVQAFRRLGHEVEVAGIADAEQEQQDATREAAEGAWKKLIRHIPLAYELVQLLYNVFAVAWLLWKVRRGGVDFIYERYSLFNFAGVLTAKFSRRPIILEVNSPQALEQAMEKEIRAAKFARWAERVVCNAATRVIVVSGPLARILKANGVRESKLTLMPNGVNLEQLRSVSGAALRKSLGLEGKVVIGFVGWFRKWHGLEFLLQTFQEARLASRGAVLLLIGDGPINGQLRAYTEAHGLGESVIFSGPIPHERISPYLDVIDIAVQPAANPYCCPMKILEYMGLGKAIIAPQQENIQELLCTGEQAVLFDPGNSEALGVALASLIEDAEKRQRLGRKALERIYQRGLLWTRNAEAVVRMVERERIQLRPGNGTARADGKESEMKSKLPILNQIVRVGLSVVLCVAVLACLLGLRRSQGSVANGNLASQATAVITLDPTVSYQRISGWEATAQAGQDECPGFASYGSLMFDQAANDLGINRLRVELRANSDGRTFNLARLDDRINRIVLPLRQRLAQRSEKLFLNVCFVGESQLSNDAGQYARQVLATYQHLETAFGLVPDAWEVVLEPTVVSRWWTPQSIGNAIVAAGNLLESKGYQPYFIAPSTPGGANNALTWFDAISKHVPSVFPYLKELSYHRYDTTDPYLPQIAARAAQFRIDTSMLEHIAADYNELHKDLKLGNVAAWEQYTLAFCTSDNGAQYYVVNGNSFSSGSRTKFLRQYFKFIRAGALRINAQSTNDNLDPVAFINTDGTYVLVIKAAAGASFSVENLPSSTYGIKYTTNQEYNVDQADVVLREGESLNSSIPSTGVITVYQRPRVTSGPKIRSIVNAASYQGGPVAPGEIVAIFGSELGPDASKGLQMTPEGLVDNTLAGASVMFNDSPAPLLYVQASQINAVVPYATAGRTNARLQVRSPSGDSDILVVPVEKAALGIFTSDGSGRGQGAILNEDGTVNSGSNPAVRGTVISLFATGEGQTDPAGVDGKPVVGLLPRPLLPVSVTVGGVPSEVQYAGGAPGLVAGVLQINVKVPDDAPTGNSVPVYLMAENYAGQAGVTVAVR